MKPYAQTLDRRHGWKGKKLSTKDDAYHPTRRGYLIPNPELHDKSAGGSSRPTAKRTIRNAKRAQKKSARQRLKQENTEYS